MIDLTQSVLEYLDTGIIDEAWLWENDKFKIDEEFVEELYLQLQIQETELGL